VETSAIAASSCRTIHTIRWLKFEKGGEKDVKRVFVARHPTEAHFMKDLLEAEGIASEIQGEDLFGARGETPLTPDTLPSVWVVNDADEDRAREFVSKYEEQEKATPSPVATWTCPACGETVEQQFSQCWNCNTPDQRSGR
jgi:hypothetical protein